MLCGVMSTMNDQFTPEEQALIEQLRSTPEPRLRPSAVEAIRQQMLDELRALPVSDQPARLPERGSNGWLRRLPVLITAVIALAATTLIWLLSQNQDQASSISATQQATHVVQVATLAATPTVTATRPTTTASATSESPVETPVALQPTPLLTLTIQPEPDAEPHTSATPKPAAVIAIEGPVSSIVGNVMTIYGIEVVVEPGHPILTLVDVGDVVRVEGVQESGSAMIASVVSNLTEVTPVHNGETATVGLEGRVESIRENTIVVNNIPVQLDPDDPILRTLEVGSFVSIQGNFQNSGTAIVLVVVEITVMNDVTVIENNCWYHDTAMGMGHWHCDGMGMGGMGMGGMGMGDSGMEAMGMGG